MLIYKILLPSEWAELEHAGRFDGSPFDLSSGFIHCSSRQQVGPTAMRLFDDQGALVVIAVDAAALGDAVRWEPVPHGETFPHIYGVLPRSAVVDVHHVAGAALVDEVLPAG
jgi:uncharacterized protein (DUF952 family)